MPAGETCLQKTTLGNFELIALNDGGYFLDGGAMFGVVPRVMWEKRIQPDAKNRIRLGLNSLVIRTDEHTILVETGIGDKLPEKQVRIYENEMLLMRQLAEAGIAPDEIDIVINTHLHFDHCGWNTCRRQDGVAVPTFPRAKYYIQKGELEHAHEQHERDRVSYMTDNYDPVVRAGQAVLLEGNSEIVPGVEVRLYPGHTRHHQAVIVRSEGKSACYPGDLVPTAAHLSPTWVMAYDLFPLETIANRHRLYDEAVPQRWLFAFTHDYDTPLAYVTQASDGTYQIEAMR